MKIHIFTEFKLMLVKKVRNTYLLLKVKLHIMNVLNKHFVVFSKLKVIIIHLQITNPVLFHVVKIALESHMFGK